MPIRRPFNGPSLWSSDRATAPRVSGPGLPGLSVLLALACPLAAAAQGVPPAVTPQAPPPAPTGTVDGTDDLSQLGCEELWLRRNQIYADRGFCFKSERAITVFGQRCFPPFGQLTEADQKALDVLRAAERALKCKIEG
jgi:hypothetical protein